MRRILTQYRHLYNPDGSRRALPCPGYLEVVCEDDGVYVRCDECEESYQLEFVMPDSVPVNRKARGCE